MRENKLCGILFDCPWVAGAQELALGGQAVIEGLDYSVL